MSDPKITMSDITAKSIEYHERKKKKHKKRHHHHHRRKSETSFNFDVPGVVHVVIDPEMQKVLQCVVGEHVTAEKPWTKIQKQILVEQLETEEIAVEYLPFYKYKQEIINYPTDEMMIGYIPDEIREYDEFYFCTTPQSLEVVLEIIKHLEEVQQERLNNTLKKPVRPWKSLGSEIEVDENNSKNNRSLYKIEFETKYPIMIPEVKFKLRLVKNARDGYMELVVPSRITIQNIIRKRINTEVQAAPPVVNADVQTSFGYPKNKWTAYSYSYDPIIVTDKEFIKHFKEFADNSVGKITDKLFVNNNINFFSDDYNGLIAKKTDVMKLVQTEEFLSFKDIEKCKDKMIAALDWHPLWTGIVAIAYANLSPRWFKKFTGHGADEYLEEAVFGYNPILIWSFSDGLSPKLLLETTAEVNCLAFCKHDPNILIGGCINGSVCVWDIRNKLEKVEEEEILTTAQHSYRKLMFSMMKWMKNTKDLSIVPITAVSELQYSHHHNITSISWIHPFYELTPVGHYEQIQNADENNYSLQFVTSGADGCIKFWDLKQKPIMAPGDYKPQRKSRRLKKRPSALTLDVSPFRILNRKLKPHYQVSVTLPKQVTTCPLGCINIYHPLEYIEVDRNSSRDFNISDRIVYNPIFKQLPNVPTTEFSAGSYLGDFVFGAWEGFDFLSGDVINKETCKLVNVGRYHDGPVLTISRHPIMGDIYLTVGGKVFAIWKESLKGKPLLWRRSRYKYTHGNWSIKPGNFRLNRSDGNREIWDLFARSDTFYVEIAYSGKALLEGVIHELKVKELKTFVVGLADENGTFRIMFLEPMKYNKDEEKEFVEKLFNINEQRKVEFEKWQENWTNIHASWIKQQQEEAIAEQIRKREEEILQKQMEEELKAQEAVLAAKRSAAKLRPPPGQYNEWAHEQWIVKEQERMGNVLLKMKRLEKETLVSQQVPLKKIEAENERKLQKQKQHLERAGDIFNETIAMLFPDLVEGELKREDADYELSNEELNEAKQGYFEAYKDIQEENIEYIKEHPYSYDFKWGEVLQAAFLKKKSEDSTSVKSARTKRSRHSDIRVGFVVKSMSNVGNDKDEPDDSDDDHSREQKPRSSLTISSKRSI